MKNYFVTLNYIKENKEIKIRAPNIRLLKYLLEKMFINKKELVHVNFLTNKCFYAKVLHQDWFYSRGK